MEVNPESGHSKYMYLGQLFEGAEAIQFFQKGIELMVKEREAQSAQEVYNYTILDLRRILYYVFVKHKWKINGALLKS